MATYFNLFVNFFLIRILPKRIKSRRVIYKASQFFAPALDRVLLLQTPIGFVKEIFVRSINQLKLLLS